jgi:hypothetical protein
MYPTEKTIKADRAAHDEAIAGHGWCFMPIRFPSSQSALHWVTSSCSGGLRLEMRRRVLEVNDAMPTRR